MNTDNKTDKAVIAPPSLPVGVALPINRCNLPPAILGGLTFQQHPQPLQLDGVAELHKQLFQQLNTLPDEQTRAQRFIDYIVVQFRLHLLEEAGLNETTERGKADYLRLLRGWLFDTNSREAAVLKSWVESRFGLMPRHHGGPLRDAQGENYQRYLAARSEGLYGTNALEAQLDLLYSYCQYELALRYPQSQRLTLYRGINHLDEYETVDTSGRQQRTMLLNNLNSFSQQRERADEFGDIVIEVEVPWQKVMFYSRLLPDHHIGEDEYMVIGGVYTVKVHYW